jgi:hypothetical protein
MNAVSRVGGAERGLGCRRRGDSETLGCRKSQVIDHRPAQKPATAVVGANGDR